LIRKKSVKKNATLFFGSEGRITNFIKSRPLLAKVDSLVFVSGLVCFFTRPNKRLIPLDQFSRENILPSHFLNIGKTRSKQGILRKIREKRALLDRVSGNVKRYGYDKITLSAGDKFIVNRGDMEILARLREQLPQYQEELLFRKEMRYDKGVRRHRWRKGKI